MSNVTLTCQGDHSWSTMDCGNSTTCYFYCESTKCFESSILNAQNTQNLIVISKASECMKKSTINLPDYGNASFSMIDNGAKSFKEMIVNSGSKTQNIFIDCTYGSGDECKQMIINATSAQYLEIKIGANSEYEGKNNDDKAAIIHCPQNSDYNGPEIASCIIDVSEGGLLQLAQIHTLNGIPKDVWIKSGTTELDTVTINCDMGISQNNGNSFKNEGDCWDTLSPTTDPTYTPTTNTQTPSETPSESPTELPTISPSNLPTLSPTHATSSPTMNPTKATMIPSISPSIGPIIMDYSTTDLFPKQYSTNMIIGTDDILSTIQTRSDSNEVTTTLTRRGTLAGIDNATNNSPSPVQDLIITMLCAGIVIMLCMIGVMGYKRFVSNKMKNQIKNAMKDKGEGGNVNNDESPPPDFVAEGWSNHGDIDHPPMPYRKEGTVDLAIALSRDELANLSDHHSNGVGILEGLHETKLKVPDSAQADSDIEINLEISKHFEDDLSSNANSIDNVENDRKLTIPMKYKTPRPPPRKPSQASRISMEQSENYVIEPGGISRTNTVIYNGDGDDGMDVTKEDSLFESSSSESDIIADPLNHLAVEEGNPTKRKPKMSLPSGKTPRQWMD